MYYTIERTPDGRARLTLLDAGARTAITVAPAELFSMAVEIMDSCYRWDEEDGGVPRYTLCDACASVIERDATAPDGGPS